MEKIKILAHMEICGIKVDKNFDMCLTACTLALQTTNCGVTQEKIPDGIYIIKYSVSPNK